ARLRAGRKCDQTKMLSFWIARLPRATNGRAAIFPCAMTRPSPLIGTTADSEEPGGYSKFPWYALRQNYCSAITKAGGVPLVLPHEPELVGHYAEMLDGLVVSGGAFDVD